MMMSQCKNISHQVETCWKAFDDYNCNDDVDVGDDDDDDVGGGDGDDDDEPVQENIPPGHGAADQHPDRGRDGRGA